MLPPLLLLLLPLLCGCGRLHLYEFKMGLVVGETHLFSHEYMTLIQNDNARTWILLCESFHAKAAQFMSRYQNDDDTHQMGNIEEMKRNKEK